LVHGDILLIPPRGCILQCDAVLMTGTVIGNFFKLLYYFIF